MPAPVRRRASHSLEAVVEAAVALLDEAGEGALTFRALASRLGGGVGSIYWYVDGKDELLDRAADHVMGEVLVATEQLLDDPDPIENLRQLSVALYDEMLRRPWLGIFLMRNTDLQTNTMRMFDRLGRQAMRLDLTPKQQMEAVMTLVGYVVGLAIDVAQPPPQEFVDSGLSPDEFLRMYADRWRALDPDEFPFLQQTAGEFEKHDDSEVFRAGLDLLLAGLRQQAGG
ncbi:TetR/AcrR family transcriptional regulator [Aeromicrobium fastidiosum]|uniref:TetR/AcrR family transcriptional regulator n=1 Tax=Aeromicrobium fastidiosum TaxID=52699 RepID=A0A641APE7_9ACTN|nr:TetR/AcrR family transcriptional regulator [Aeromicrobium fastidiosum]KAA1379976.1 TetR/AcrR family transcriptional regulator [Aeromicrobium fastidiosum]MBP2389492.1 AcrR family transcriptional regulator [Aeromicrobium fastidiosum]